MLATTRTPVVIGRDADGGEATSRARASRSLLAQGERPVFSVWYRPTEDGYVVDLVDLPARIRVTGRKGIERAARDRIALELELPEDAFELNIRPLPRNRSRSASRPDLED
jgi:hypothetical protein